MLQDLVQTLAGCADFRDHLKCTNQPSRLFSIAKTYSILSMEELKLSPNILMTRGILTCTHVGAERRGAHAEGTCTGGARRAMRPPLETCTAGRAVRAQLKRRAVRSLGAALYAGHAARGPRGRGGREPPLGARFPVTGTGIPRISVPSVPFRLFPGIRGFS